MNSIRLLPDKPISRAPALARDQVATHLRDSITNLRLPSGTQLIEREICEATTASRATVREALRQLETEGLVESDSGRGVTVKTLSRKEAAEIYEVRAPLEGLTCRLFAKNSSVEQRALLRRTFEEMAEVVSDPVLMLQRKDAFYDVLFIGAGNSELQNVLMRLRRRIKLLQANTLAVPGRPAQSLKEIEGVVEAIETGKAKLAESRCIAHVKAARKTLLDSRSLISGDRIGTDARMTRG
jgi:DNA-binding GntR family transcriptional regulator